MIRVKYLLSIMTAAILLTSCLLPERREFEYHLQDLDTYMRVSKRRGGTCYITFSDNPERLSEKDSIDYITTSNVDECFLIVYDTINKRDMYVSSGSFAVHSVKYNIKIYESPFDDAIYEEKTGTEPRRFRKEFGYVSMDLRHFSVEHNGIEIKKGNLFGD